MSETGEKSYQVLARKYRPATFADLVGQEAMVRTLKNAFIFKACNHESTASSQNRSLLSNVV